MTGRGSLRVSIDDQSVWLSNNLPYVVRDAASTLVGQGRVGDRGPGDLPEGYYSVEVVTPSGAPHTEIVQVRAGETYPLVIGDTGRTSPGDDRIVEPADAETPPPQAAAPPPPPPPPPPAAPPMPAPLTAGARAPTAGGVSPSPGRLLSTEHCTAHEDEDGWTFTPVPELRAVPTARFAHDGQPPWVVSLALNPAGTDEELRQCRVVTGTPGGSPPRPVASFTGRRRVSRMLEGVLRHHQLMSADLIDQAAGLLLSKYSDPPAAVLGGLTLHRLGRLQERQDWIENLARDFTWLPDGQVLCAALLMHDEDPDERTRGLELLLGASAERPLYTDGLSLATDLLRRWPGDAYADERTERLERLADFACATDWDAVMLTHQEGW